MAKLQRTRAKAKSGHGNRPQDRYREWLHTCHYYQVCAYCLTSFDNLEIEHYVPEALLLRLKQDPHTPKNLYLACHDCNSNKLDYHPKNKLRRRFRKITPGFTVLNSFKHDFLLFYEIDNEGNLLQNSSSSRKFREQAKQNILLMGFDERHVLADKRARLIGAAQVLENVIREVSVAALEYNLDVRRAARLVWRNRLFFDAFEIDLSPKLARFAENEWRIWCRANSIVFTAKI